MKIYIVGTVGSGKSTLSRKLGDRLNIPVYHLDEVVHQKDESTKTGNNKRADDEIERIFQEILKQNSFIIEDCLRERFIPALHQVDKVVYIDLPMKVLKYRVVKRFLKQKLRIEKSAYRPSLQFLKLMFIWLKESPHEKVKDLPNLVVLKNKKAVNRFLTEMKEDYDEKLLGSDLSQ